MNDLEKEEVRREILELREEVKELRKENRRLLEDRRGGGNLFENLMIISIILFTLSVLAYFIIPPYLKTNYTMESAVRMSYLGWVSFAGIGLWVFPILSTVFWFLKKKG